MTDGEHVTVYKERVVPEGADKCEQHDYDHEYVAAAMACMFFIIPRPIATAIAVNGYLRHITSAHRMSSAVLFCVWDGFCSTAFASYINLHACAQPLSVSLTGVGILGIIASCFCAKTVRTQVLMRVLLVQTPGFVATLHFSLVC